MTASGVSSHRVTEPQPRRRFDKRYLYVAIVLAVAVVAGVVYAVWPSSSSSESPLAGSQHAGSLVLNATGSELAQYARVSFTPGRTLLEAALGR